MLDLLAFIQQFSFGRFGIALTGIIAICSLIWFALPQVGITSVWQRIMLMAAVILIYLAVVILRWLLAKLRGNKIHKELQNQEEKVAGRQLEIELLKEKMNDAIGALKSSELGIKYRGSAALYALPWFMIIGPSAAGKSTLLRNSGLHFPFSSREDLQVKGFGGTRNCDWWFSDEAILLDTAGRYTTEDDDREEWRSFLQILKKQRPKLPINGIIVAMSLVDLLTSDAEGINWHVNVIRGRIEELYNQLGYVFPVYLTLTKCDLLKGFATFFGDLSETERRQVWGLNLLHESNIYEQQISSFENKLNQLYSKLTQLRIHKLSLERNAQRKIDIYDFVEQFHAAIPKIMDFIRLLFKQNPYQETPHFCGAYFTSGTQEGTMIQRLVGNLRAAFGYVENKANDITTAPNEMKSYFIKDVFSAVIFPNQKLVAKTRQRLQAQYWLKSASVVAAGIMIVGAFFLYSTSFTSNVILLWHGERVAKTLADSYHTKNFTSNIVTDNLVSAYHYYHNLENYRKQVPLHLRLGLYRGNTQMMPLQQMLVAAMHQSFLQPIGTYLEQRLNDYYQPWATANSQQREQLRGQYYTTLKSYLMLSFPERIEINQATPALSAAWSRLLSGTANPDSFQQQENTQRYAGLVQFYLDQLKQQDIKQKKIQRWQARGDLVVQARQQLYSPITGDNLYAQLRNVGKTALPAISLQQLVQGYGANLLISNAELPGNDNEITLYHKALKVIKDIDSRVKSETEAPSWYFGLDEFGQHLKNVMAEYQIEDDKIVHTSQQASRAMVEAFQLMQMPNAAFNSIIESKLDQCGQIIARYGTAEQQDMFSKALKEYQDNDVGFFLHLQSNFEKYILEFAALFTGEKDYDPEPEPDTY